MVGLTINTPVKIMPTARVKSVEKGTKRETKFGDILGLLMIPTDVLLARL